MQCPQFVVDKLSRTAVFCSKAYLLLFAAGITSLAIGWVIKKKRESRTVSSFHA